MNNRMIVLVDTGEYVAAIGPVMERNVDRIREEAEEMGWEPYGQAVPLAVADFRAQLREHRRAGKSAAVSV